MSKSVAIVTGSSSGIGKATAIRLSHDFSAVVLAARSAAELGEVAEQVRVNGAEPLPIDLDLMALTAAETVISQTLAKFGRIDALVNIAGAVPGWTSTHAVSPYQPVAHPQDTHCLSGTDQQS